MGKIFCVEFEILHLKFPTKYLNPYIERCNFYTTLTFQELKDLRARKCIWNALMVNASYVKPRIIGIIKAPGKLWFLMTFVCYIKQCLFGRTDLNVSRLFDWFFY